MFLKRWFRNNLVGSVAVAVIATGILVVVQCLTPASVFGAETVQRPQVSAEAAVVYCVNSGEVLYAKNETEQLAMASTTKIMTSLLTLEAAAVENRPVTITQEMVAVEGSSMGLRAGDVLRLRKLAVGMLTVSGNDAANAAAIAVGGTTENFAKLMNARAKELGMENTNFVTPSGLDDDAHYTTALDMAKLGAAAIGNADFREICQQKSMEATWETPKKTVTLYNHNRLLSMYEGCIGMKTGYTKKAGRCLVSAAEKDGVILIAVTLSAPNDWQDHKAMLDYGFSQVDSYQIGSQESLTYTLPVVGGTASQVQVQGVPEEDVILLKKGQTVTTQVFLPRFVYGPVEQGEVLGSITYQVEGETVATVSLAATQAVDGQEVKESTWEKVTRLFLAIFS